LRSNPQAARRDGESRPTGREASLIDVTRFTRMAASAASNVSFGWEADIAAM
jgi:hypothetical protein